MKTKLLRKVRNKGRRMINIISITKTNGYVTGMSYGYDFDDYKSLFKFGDTEQDVIEKAARIYIISNFEHIRKQYKKYSRTYK